MGLICEVCQKENADTSYICFYCGSSLSFDEEFINIDEIKNQVNII